jgi:hypothetical protein
MLGTLGQALGTVVSRAIDIANCEFAVRDDSNTVEIVAGGVDGEPFAASIDLPDEFLALSLQNIPEPSRLRLSHDGISL